MKSNLTQAQSLLLQSLIPLVAGAVVTTATTVYQAFITGHIDPNTVASFLLATFLATLGQALKAYVPAHIPQELQAVKDTQDEILSIVNGFTAPRPVVKPLTGPTAVVPAFTPPARPATIQATTLPDVPQQPFPVAPPAQPLTPDTGG